MKINRLLPAKLPLYIVSCLYFRALCWHVFIRTLLLRTYSKWSSFGHCLVIVLSCIWLWKFEVCPFCTWCSFTFHTQLLEASFRTGGKSTSSAFNFKIMFVQRTSLFTVIVLCVCDSDRSWDFHGTSGINVLVWLFLIDLWARAHILWGPFFFSWWRSEMIYIVV